MRRAGAEGPRCGGSGAGDGPPRGGDPRAREGQLRARGEADDIPAPDGAERIRAGQVLDYIDGGRGGADTDEAAFSEREYGVEDSR